MRLILQTMVVQLPWNTNGIGASNQTACVSKYGQFFYRGKTNFAHEDLLMKYCYLSFPV
jgi:hypothetical protein